MTAAQWNRVGGLAGIGYVVLSVVASFLTGTPPAPDFSDAEIKTFYLEKQHALVTQAWLITLGGALILWFAIAVRRILRARRANRTLADLFFAGTVVIVTVLVIAMAMQMVFAKTAADLPPETVRAIGVDFGVVVVAMWGFVVATTAIAYAVCVFTEPALPRWTAWLAIAAAVMNVVGTTGVFVASGPFSMEGAVTEWAPGVLIMLWYLGTAIALLRAGADGSSSGMNRNLDQA
jgi:hypothetical protein